MTDDDLPITSLLDLDADAFSSLTSACTAASLSRLAGTCKVLAEATAQDECWIAVLHRDFDVPASRSRFYISMHGFCARDLYKRIYTTPPGELRLRGFFTDGGIDSSDIGASEAQSQPVGSASVLSFGAEHPASQFWADSAFCSDSDARTFCSDVRRNILVGALVQGQVGADALQARAALVERRKFIIERLSFVATEYWGWHVHGFGGLDHSSTGILERALFVAWHNPMVRAGLTHGLGGARRTAANRRLEQIVNSMQPPKTLDLLCLRLQGHGGQIHEVLVDMQVVNATRAWRLEALRQRASVSSGATALQASRSAAALEREIAEAKEVSDGVRDATSAAAAVAHAGEAESSDDDEEEDDDEDDDEGGAAGGGQGGATEFAFCTPLKEHKAEMGTLIAEPGKLSVVTELQIARGIHCSCPVSVGFVLGCRSALSLAALYASPAVRALDDITDLAQLPRSRDEALRTGSALPYVTCVHSLDEGEVAELGGPVGMVGMVGTGGGGGGEGGGGDEGGNDDGSEEATVSSVFPIAFFRFSHTLADAQARAARERGWKETGWLRTSLRQPRCTGMLIAKLIAPENRMEAMEDDHAEPNIE